MKWNNPGNIRPSGDNWLGMTGVTPSNFVIFDTIAHGYRAQLKTLITYIRRGKNTVALIIPTWAPASDNNQPEQYIRAVEQMSGIDRNTAIGSADWYKLGKVAYAMSIVEKGDEARTPQAQQALVDAINMLKGTMPPPSAKPEPKPDTPRDPSLFILPLAILLIAAISLQNIGKART